VITSRDDFRRYRRADLAARGLERWHWWCASAEPEAAFQRALRRLEYLQNCRRDPIGRLLFRVLQLRFRRRSIALGFSIPLNVFGPGLCIAHYGSIVVSGRAEVGRNCRIHSGVNIGENEAGAPLVGNDVYLGPGAKLFGAVTIGHGVAVGANTVVNANVRSGVTVAGVPFRIVSERGSRGLVNDGAGGAGIE
jgi:serine O-acetyltransferase